MTWEVCPCTALKLSEMQDQKSLTLHWRPYLWGGSIILTGDCAYKDGRYFDHGITLLRSPVIIQHARPEFSNTLLMLISRMVQLAYSLPFYIHSWPKTPAWIEVTMQPFDCRDDQTKIVDVLLTVLLETYQQSLGAQSFSLKFIPSFLTANRPFQGIIMCIHKHRDLSVSEPPPFMSSVW
jgi:hypothetical protein